MIYEIINMSDPYTIEAHSLEVAAVACLCLGRGQYAFEPVEVDTKVPMFMFGDADSWFMDRFGVDLRTVMDRVMAEGLELAACFESCLIGGERDRQTYQRGLALIDDPTKREEWRLKWHEARRSSLNDIGGRAWEMAKRLRAGSKNPLVAAPQQVFAS